MALSRPFAYNNTGSPISGTIQYGDLVVGDIEENYGADYGGVIWWGGPDEDLRYIIGNVRPGGQPVPSGVTETANVGFWGTPLGDKTEGAFLNLANYVGYKNGQPPFANANDAVIWLNDNGFYTSYIPVTPSYGYNLVVLPYEPPTSGNTIFTTFADGNISGTTNPNTFTTNGVLWNTIDNTSVDRTNYYSGMTGVSVTVYFIQNGDGAFYSGSTSAFTIEGPPGQEFVNYNPNIVPGQLVLIQPASTNFVTGQTVYIGYVVN